MFYKCFNIVLYVYIRHPGMSMEDIRKYESRMQNETNEKVGNTIVVAATLNGAEGASATPLTPTNTPIDKKAPVSFSSSDDNSN